MSDPIRNPAHYTAHPVQQIEISRYLGFCLGNVVKYILRAPYKGRAEDLRKALQYLEWEAQTPMRRLTPMTLERVTGAIADLRAFLLESDAPYGRPQSHFLDRLEIYLGRNPASVGAHTTLGIMGDIVRAFLETLEAPAADLPEQDGE